ncbi:hypothetical protein MIMGU_mgv1a026239mg, partial [Erythranthe guttata]
ATESNPVEWTDEKHYSFLKSMESTFVDQLYKSHKTSAASSQLKVLRDGRWSTIDLKRDKSVQEVSKVPSRNPWIKHYRGSDLQPIRKFQSSSAKSPLANTQNRTRNFQLWRQDSIGSSTTETTDQNFNEEGNSDVKRTKTTTDVVSSNDQVVPSNDTVRVQVRVRVDDVIEK